MYNQNEWFNQNSYLQNYYNQSHYPQATYLVDPTFQYMNYYGVHHQSPFQYSERGEPNNPNYTSSNYNSEEKLINEVEEAMNQYVSPFIQYFQDENGEIDLDKVFYTVNQVVKTANEVSPIVKSVNNFVRKLR